MKRLAFLIPLIAIVNVNSYSQIIYSDNFDEGILKVEQTSAYTSSLSDNNLLISGNGTAGAYAAFAYNTHNNDTNTNINIESAPKLFIKAKGTNNPDLRIDIQDDNDFVTNFSSQSIRLSNEFEIYELDYTGKLQDGGFGGSPCTSISAPCPVDATNINRIVFFVNAAIGGYSGAIEIDWISFGEPLEAIPPPSEFDIRYNQVSYLKGKDKLINIVAISSFSDKTYTVYDNANNIITSGTTGASSLWSDSGEHVATVDISSIDIEGTYRFTIDELEVSFNISKDGYEDLREEVFKYFYYNRASTALSAAFAGEFARNLGHPDTQVIVHASAASTERPTGTIISAPKGWYDAGDYNKYIVNSGISTYTLLAAYEHYTSYYENLDFSIPEQGGDIPDILDEAIWNLDWMLAMQDYDGGVYHKLTGLNFSGNIMPDQYTMDRYVVQKTTAAALNFAAVMAVASRLFAKFETEKPGYSASLLEAAKDAYSWAKANPTIYYNQPSDVNTGAYGDNNVSDEFQWAAVELFITTDQIQYKNDINIGQIEEGTPSWSYTAPLALISIAHHTVKLAEDINVTSATNKLIETADQLKNTIENSPMRIAMSTSDYVWGSNGNTGNQLVILIRAYELTNNNSYLDAAYTAMDYLFGRNGTGYSFVTGFGDRQVLDPHHRISVADNVALPVPGMLAGGPHSGQQDGCSGYPNNNPASSFVDDYCSYSTNEITINWNAPLVYAMHALHFYQNESITLSVNTFEETSDTFRVSPNPTNRILNIKIPISVSSSNIEMYSIKGKKVLSKELNGATSNLDISNLNPGLYLIKIITENQNYITKIVKQ